MKQALDQAVDPVGDPTVRRGAVSERLEQEAEALARLLGGDPDRLEDLLLDGGLGDPDLAAAHLLAVPDHVVGERPRLAGPRRVELARG